MQGAFPEAMVRIYALGLARIYRPLVPLMVVQEGIQVQAADPPHPAGQQLRHLLRPFRHSLLLHLSLIKRQIRFLIGAALDVLYTFYNTNFFGVTETYDRKFDSQKMRTLWSFSRLLEDMFKHNNAQKEAVP
jgi:hypothetical protein